MSWSTLAMLAITFVYHPGCKRLELFVGNSALLPGTPMPSDFPILVLADQLEPENLYEHTPPFRGPAEAGVPPLRLGSLPLLLLLLLLLDRDPEISERMLKVRWMRGRSVGRQAHTIPIFDSTSSQIPKFTTVPEIVGQLSCSSRS